MRIKQLHVHGEDCEPKTFWYMLWELLRDDEPRGGFMVSRFSYAPSSTYETRLLNQAMDDIQAIIAEW